MIRIRIKAQQDVDKNGEVVKVCDAVVVDVAGDRHADEAKVVEGGPQLAVVTRVGKDAIDTLRIGGMRGGDLWELGALYEIMLDRIAAETVPERLGRNEPRMKRRETKHYEALRTTREEWRQTHAAA